MAGSAPKLTAAQAFALWLEANEPAVFQHLLALAPSSSSATPASGAPASLSGLGDWSDILTSLSSDVSSAVSDVGTYLSSSSGQTSLSSVIQSYLSSPATSTQGQVLQTQAQLAAAGKAPAPIGYTTTATGQVVPVYTGVAANGMIANAVASGQAQPAVTNTGLPGYTLTPGLTASLSPAGAGNSSVVLLGAGALAFAYFALRRR